MSSRTLLVKGCRESFFLTTLCVCSYIVYIIVATAPLMLQDGPHSVRLQWDPPTPLGSTMGTKSATLVVAMAVAMLVGLN